MLVFLPNSLFCFLFSEPSNILRCLGISALVVFFSISLREFTVNIHLWFRVGLRVFFTRAFHCSDLATLAFCKHEPSATVRPSVEAATKSAHSAARTPLCVRRCRFSKQSVGRPNAALLSPSPAAAAVCGVCDSGQSACLHVGRDGDSRSGSL